MNTIIELILRVVDLLEAEGRNAKRHVVGVLAAVVVWLAALYFVLTGFFVVLGALFLGLNEVMHAAWALLIVSIVPLLLGVACVFIGRGMVRERP